jgi:hypothetical protein
MASNEEVDLELIAAFIDGHLTGAERERAIKLLGESEAAFEVYVDALRARADLGDRTVIPITEARRPRASRWRVAIPFAVAALLMVAVFPAIRTIRNREAGDPRLLRVGTAVMPDSPVSAIARPLLAESTDLPAALGAGWDERGWSVYRGTSSALVDSTTAFRLGVRATDLRVALAAGETERAGRLTGELLDLLKPVKLADAVRANYTDVRARLSSGGVTPDILGRASRAENDLADFLDSRWFTLGKWFAASEVAARARSTSFFAAPNTALFLDWATHRGSLAPRDAEVLRQVAVLADRGVTGSDFDTIRERFAELIRRYGE